MTTVPEKLLEPLEGGKIREKLRATCMSRSRKTEDDQKRGPLMVKHPEGVAEIKKTMLQENTVSIINMTNKRSCRTPSPPRSCSKPSTNLTKLASSPALNLLCPDKPHTEALVPSKGINQPCSQPSSPGPILRSPIRVKPVPRPPSPSMHLNERRASSPTSGPNHELMERIREQISKVQRAKLYLLRQLGPCSFWLLETCQTKNIKLLLDLRLARATEGPIVSTCSLLCSGYYK
ncbi:uncharacterized protein LOC106474087 [Limulus polyphemus]|uniref:Uncharacterized protein LOC106474087 n=1 Tax=Limulus polyphemus TaxID=6850 RepID=A0ABM1BWW5_LIMPO|nr:uncharacterized protein LOC106474087 [Limulus polyphemus]XP_022258176.1 uncharacterized protein LOC106474087 [Limulus polyphemus]